MLGRLVPRVARALQQSSQRFASNYSVARGCIPEARNVLWTKQSVLSGVNRQVASAFGARTRVIYPDDFENGVRKSKLEKAEDEDDPFKDEDEERTLYSKYNEKGELVSFPGQPTRIPKLPMQKVLSINRVALVKRGGKELRFGAIVIVGNGKGLAGIGKGKDAEMSRAVEKATLRAHRPCNLHYFELYDQRTIFHDIEHTYKKTKVVARCNKEGGGLRVNNTLYEMCEAIGITDLTAKVHGSTNPHNMVRCFWEALQRVRTPEQVSRFRGKAMIDMGMLRAGLGPGQSTIKPAGFVATAAAAALHGSERHPSRADKSRDPRD